MEWFTGCLFKTVVMLKMALNTMYTIGLNAFIRDFQLIIHCYRRPEELHVEEQKIKTANERALQEMQDRMERELEDAKLELLEVIKQNFLNSLPNNKS